MPGRAAATALTGHAVVQHWEAIMAIEMTESPDDVFPAETWRRPSGLASPTDLLVLSVGLLIAWLLGSMSDRAGLAWFLILATTIVMAWAFAIRGSRRLLLVLLAMGVLAAATLLTVEGAIRAWPAILPMGARNHVYGGYHARTGGIYRLDLETLYALRPNRDQWLQWNGHPWRHRTNVAGYRGPGHERVDAVFLGDSMIYGHGVEENETVAGCFSILTGESAANLGQQGTSALQALAVFERTGANLRPRVVYHCSHYNDLPELEMVYDRRTLARLIDTPADRPFTIRVAGSGQFQFEQSWQVWWRERAAIPLATARLYGFITSMPWTVVAPSAPMDAGEPVYAPPRDFVDNVDAIEGGPNGLPWRAHAQSLKRIKARCDSLGARLVLFDIGYPRPFSAAIEELARSMGATYSPAGRVVLERAFAGEAVYLAHDGHWSPLGGQLIAKELARSFTAACSANDYSGTRSTAAVSCPR